MIDTNYSQLNVGVNLQMDPAIEETCKVANASTNNTRAVLYLIIVITVFAFFGFVNARVPNWLDDRISYCERKIAFDTTMGTFILDNLKYSNYVGSLILCKEPYLKYNFPLGDTSSLNLKDYANNLKLEAVELEYHRKKYYDLLYEQSYLVNIPLQIRVDINDLGVVFSITIALMFLILLFTLDREINNLKLAFQAITYRYTDTSDLKDFDSIYKSIKEQEALGYVKDVFKNQNPSRNEKTEMFEFVKTINFIRREHHYNYLTMNEIFTFPTLINRYRSSEFKKIVSYVVFVFPLFVQIIIFHSDWASMEDGFLADKTGTVKNLIAQIVAIAIIGLVTIFCIRRKYLFSKLWDHFYNNGYRTD